jgi:hypothetical protein
MDDSVVILVLAALALVIQLSLIRLMIRADDALLWDSHFQRLVRAPRNARWDSWWVNHEGYVTH